ncbi:MAG: S-methyl-5'-thioadenosine phosphorylase [Proteobacteria bacterium]|nr:S-methyl-5'-thioadenosine phosphorylase [Pseudomonadota bacterium]
MDETTIGIIGGSGLYDLEDLTQIREHQVETPFGSPSDVIVEGRLGSSRLLFIARHGRGHRFLPTEVNYRANIFALKMLGAQSVISISAVGSMREDIRPGDLIVVDQFIDRTKGRPSTFFGGGIVGHVMFADPVCPELATNIFQAASPLEVNVHKGGTLMVMEGPAFSTRAESHMHRQLGVDLIGMTAMPEAKLAREAELCYATLALATDYDCWHETEEDVSVDAIIKILKENAQNAKAIVKNLAEAALSNKTCSCASALDFAVITDRAHIPDQLKEQMKPVFGRVL